MAEHTIQVWTAPLIFFGSEFRPDGLVSEEVSYASLMGFLCRPGIGSQVSDLVMRYNEISAGRDRLPIAPNETHLMDRLIWPLRDAKASYVTGNYLGAIALCGLVAEMAAILAFDLHNEASDPVRYDEAAQRSAFGYRFEELGQARRVKELKKLGLVSDEAVAAFETLRRRRNRYLHFWSEDHAKINLDAIACFDACLTLVLWVLGMRIDGGKLALREEVFVYLNKHGVSTPWVEPVCVLDPIDETDPVDPTDRAF